MSKVKGPQGRILGKTPAPNLQTAVTAPADTRWGPEARQRSREVAPVVPPLVQEVVPLLKQASVSMYMPMREGTHAIPLGDGRHLTLEVPSGGSMVSSRLTLARRPHGPLHISDAQLEFTKPLSVKNAGQVAGVPGPFAGVVSWVAENTAIHRIEINEGLVVFGVELLGFPLGRLPGVGMFLRKALQVDLDRLVPIAFQKAAEMPLPDIEPASLLRGIGGLVEEASYDVEASLGGTAVSLNRDGVLRLSPQNSGGTHLEMQGRFALTSTDCVATFKGKLATGIGVPVSIDLRAFDGGGTAGTLGSGLHFEVGRPSQEGVLARLGGAALTLLPQMGGMVGWLAQVKGPVQLGFSDQVVTRLPTSSFDAQLRVSAQSDGSLMVGSSEARFCLRQGLQAKVGALTLELKGDAELSANVSQISTHDGHLTADPSLSATFPAMRVNGMPMAESTLEMKSDKVVFDPVAGTLQIGSARFVLQMKLPMVGDHAIPGEVTFGGGGPVTLQAEVLQTPLQVRVGPRLEQLP